MDQFDNICAFVAAGGKGTRLGALGKQTQKCMLELWGKPLLYYSIIALRNAGCNRVVIAVNYLSEQIIDYFKDGRDFGIEVTYIKDEFASTYDALYKSIESLSPRIVYIHANILFHSSLLNQMISTGNQFDKNVIAVIPNNSIDIKHAQVSFDNDRVISEIDLSECNNKHPYTFLGVAYYKKQDFIVHYNGDSSGMVEKVIQQLLQADIQSLAYIYHGDWRHIETENDYQKIRKEAKWKVEA